MVALPPFNLVQLQQTHLAVWLPGLLALHLHLSEPTFFHVSQVASVPAVICRMKMLVVQQMTLLGVDDNHADAAVMDDWASDEWF